MKVCYLNIGKKICIRKRVFFIIGIVFVVIILVFFLFYLYYEVYDLVEDGVGFFGYWIWKIFFVVVYVDY